MYTIGLTLRTTPRLTTNWFTVHSFNRRYVLPCRIGDYGRSLHLLWSLNYGPGPVPKPWEYTSFARTRTNIDSRFPAQCATSLGPRKAPSCQGPQPQLALLLELAAPSVSVGAKKGADSTKESQRANKILAWMESYRIWVLCVSISSFVSATSALISIFKCRDKCTSGDRANICAVFCNHFLHLGSK